jgi:A/G-specific adenine glycosylase
MLDLVRQKEGFRQALQAWYRRHRRPLPWREAPSLYKTVVSEFMLQQTQVATVLPYFERWLRELPDFAALAAASEERVLKLWEGLGYYSRARNLHRLARAVAARPAPPRAPAEWLELPGIGPYTAAAVTSIAFGEPAACVDGNVVRILARLTGEDRRFRDGVAAARHFAPLAGELVDPAGPGDHNQAMMELGATVCLRAAPACLVCPVAGFCAVARTGRAPDLPRFAPKRVEARTVVRLWCEDAGRLLLWRAGAAAPRLAGLHELPSAEAVGVAPAAGDAPFAVRRRTITRFRITEPIHRLEPTPALRRRLAADAAFAWVPLAELDAVVLSGPHRRWIGELLSSLPTAAPVRRRNARPRARRRGASTPAPRPA